jgi:hypothetical protein
MDTTEQVIGDTSPALAAGIALTARREGRIDVSTRADADVLLEPGGELPFEDRAVSSLHLGDAVASLSVRDQIQVLIELKEKMVVDMNKERKLMIDIN